MRSVVFSVLLIAGFFLLVGCDKKPKAMDFYSSVTKSKETGDCGGFSVWLEKKGDTYHKGFLAIYEGGCKTYKREVFEVDHDPVTRKLAFLSKTSNPKEWFIFAGHAHPKGLVGELRLFDPKTRKSLHEGHVFQGNIPKIKK